MFYLLCNFGSLRKSTLSIAQSGAHDHSNGDTNSGKIFNPQVLAVTQAVVRDTHSKQLK